MRETGFALLCLAWISSAALAQSVPTPEETGTALTVSRKEFDGATRVEFSPESDLSLPTFPIQVSPSGDHLYLQDPASVLRKISLPDFKEERRLTMTRSTMSLALSQEGLVASSGSKGRIDIDTQFWVFDPETLAVRNRFPTEFSLWVSASPNSGIVFSMPNVTKKGEQPLLLTDLKTGKLIKEISALKLQRDAKAKVQNVPLSWDEVRPTPDAKFLFNGPYSRLIRKGTDFSYVETGPASIRGGLFSFSPDSKRLGLTTETGSPTELTACIYMVEHLQKPVVTVPGAEFLAFGKGNRLIVRLGGGELAILDANGKKEKQIDMIIGNPFPRAQVGQVFVNPAGNRLVLRVAGKILCIDLAD